MTDPYSIFLVYSEAAITDRGQAHLKHHISTWLRVNGAYDGPDHHFEEFHDDIRPFRDWRVSGHLVEFIFNNRDFAQRFREELTAYEPHLVHSVKIHRKVKVKESVNDFIANTILPEAVCWCEGHKLERKTDFYFEPYGDPEHGEGFIFFFKDATMASMFKLTFV